MPKFSVILPSYLGKYRYSGKDPETKIVRAIESVLKQDDFELVIVADGCEKTIEVVNANFRNVKEIKLFQLAETRRFGAKRNAGAAGVPRNAGIQQASGEYIIYIDHDDYYVDGYLSSLKAEMDDSDWFWFDNLSWNKTTQSPDRSEPWVFSMCSATCRRNGSMPFNNYLFLLISSFL